MSNKPTAAIGHMPFPGSRTCAHLFQRRKWTTIPNWSGPTSGYADPAPRPLPPPVPASRAMRRRYKALKWLEGHRGDWSPYSSPWVLCGSLTSARTLGLCESLKIQRKGWYYCQWRLTASGAGWLRKFEELHPDFGTINLNPHVQQA